MSVRIGIDVGGTFTDFFVVRPGAAPRIFKVLSTPEDPSRGLLEGLAEIAAQEGESLEAFVRRIGTIVHGTTVATNTVLTRTGARTALFTTEGVRDALEMRRGIREEQYNNRYRNVEPLVPRYLRLPVRGRLDYAGREVEPLHPDDIEKAMPLLRRERIEAVAVCFMNAFANPAHEAAAKEVLARLLPEAYLSISSEVLPAIRFYNRVSTTVLNAYVGPRVQGYLDRLLGRLGEAGFRGKLLVMQSSGGVTTPEVARVRPALTLLSGPAAGPVAGLEFARVHGCESCLTVDMGGTSFDAALVLDGVPAMATEGEIGRLKIALPMLEITTIGAGGGSIGWLDEGGLLRMGPQSAGADPGPACYGRGGKKPTCTDADLILGYLNPDYFAGGRLRLEEEAAREAIDREIARPMGLSVEEAAAGMFRVINTNMAEGVRAVTVKRGYDPRDFPMVVAGGAGPIHACMIAEELEIPLLIVPKASAIFCAAGMLMSDLRHDLVRSAVGILGRDWDGLLAALRSLEAEGEALLAGEGLPRERRRFEVALDCRYVKQYHEVTFAVAQAALTERDAGRIAQAFHAEHRRLYGYDLEEEGTPIEVINVRLRAVGEVDRPELPEEEPGDPDPTPTRKGERRVYVPEERGFATVPVYDGHRLRHGHRLAGPALIEQATTTLFLSAAYDCAVDQLGSFVVFRKGREDLLEGAGGRSP